jgi:hypothetical protein
MIYVIAFMLTLLALMLLHGLYCGITLHRQFRKERNPFRRYCRKCDQQQDNYTVSWDTRGTGGWWEDMSPIKDPNCSCHKFAEYHH